MSSLARTTTGGGGSAHSLVASDSLDIAWFGPAIVALLVVFMPLMIALLFTFNLVVGGLLGPRTGGKSLEAI